MEDQVQNKYQAETSLGELMSKLNKWVNYLKSKLLFFLLALVVGGILGFLYSYIVKPIYTATTTFVLENGESGGAMGQIGGLASIIGIDVGAGSGGLFQGDNIIELYRSRRMIEKTLLSTLEGDSSSLIIDRYILIKGLKDKWKDDQTLANLNFSSYNDKSIDQKTKRTLDSVLSKIVKDISKKDLVVTKPDKKLNIIRVDVKSTDEVFSKSFNDVLVSNVNEFYIQTKTKKSASSVKILSNKTDSVRAVMSGAIFSAARVLDQTPNLNPTRLAQRSAPVQNSQFAAEANKAVLSELLKNLEISKINLLKESPLIQIIDQPIYPLDNSKIHPIIYILGGAAVTFFLCMLYFIVKRAFSSVS